MTRHMKVNQKLSWLDFNHSVEPHWSDIGEITKKV